jgi:protoporphyrinogen oxidase
MTKVAIIGSGVSGASLARILHEKGVEVSVFERNGKSGGLISCDVIDGNLFHKVGGHVFNSKNPEVLNWFWNHFDKEEEFLPATRRAAILLEGHLIGYPIENYLFKLPQEKIRAIVDELMELDKGSLKDPMSFSNFEAFLKSNFGPTLYDLYFKPYNEKIWRVNLSTVPMGWLEGKLPMPNYRQILVSNIVQKEESDMVHSHFYYPKQGGSQFIINRLLDNLKVNLSSEVKLIAKESDKWKVEGQEFDHVVYTGDVRELFQKLKLPGHDFTSFFDSINKLRTNGTSNILCYTDPSPLSWLYLPEPDLLCHRIIYTGNFSTENNSNPLRPTCVVEFSGEVSEQDMLDSLARLPGNLTPIAMNFETTSYVIQNHDTRSTIGKLKSILSEENLHLLGRFAEWEYYNMDKCMESAINLATSIIV